MTRAPMGPGWVRNLWHALGLLFWYLLLRGLNRVRVNHPENIPARGEYGILIASNHISALDPFVIGVTAMPFFSPVWWRAPAKEELFRIPVVRSILGSWGAFPVRRGQRDLEAIGLMGEHLGSGVVVIFPEGRRSPDGRIQPGRSGVGKLVHDARPVKVIPVRIWGADGVLPRGRVFPRFGRRITIGYGPPVDLTEYTAEPGAPEISQRITDAIMRAIGRLEPG